MDVEKLNRWAKEIHDNATAHGWHEEKHSPEHWLSLIMCEVAEAIEADRNDKYFKHYLSRMMATCKHLDRLIDREKFDFFYKKEVKGTVELEFADIVIRLLDMAVELYGDFKYSDFPPYRKTIPCETLSLEENLWFFVKCKLYNYHPLISEAIVFIYDLAEQLDIDLDQHIEWKMKYNESRPYKHGGKKY